MSDVEFLIDPDRVSRKSINIDLCGQPYDPLKLAEIRNKIRSHLESNIVSTLVVRGDETWFRKFKDFNGLFGFKMTPISAEIELGNLLGIDIPAWCNNDVIQYYGLLEKATAKNIKHSLETDEIIVSLISEELIFAETYDQLFIAVKNLNQKISPLLQSKFIISRIESILRGEFTEHYQTIIFNILQSDNCSSLIAEILQQVYLEKIRKISNECKIPLHLPARTHDLSFLEKLSFSSSWRSEVKLEPYLSKLTKQVIEKIKNKSLSADKLALLVFTFSKEQNEILMYEINENAYLATKELLGEIECLNLEELKDFQELVAMQVEGPEPDDFQGHWTASEVNAWANDYLKYVKALFNREDEPDVRFSNGFEDWVFSQPLRMHSQNYSWKIVSSRVRELLENNQCAALIIVDALGSVLAEDLLKSVGERLGANVIIESANLFAPIPTLTEIGKIAVATGVDTFKLPSGHEDALWQSYGDILKDKNALQIIKSWDGGSQQVSPETKLLVFLENQLDDMLHECITFSALQAQLNLVSKHVSNFLAHLFDINGVLYKKFEVIITADHGLTRMTKISKEPNLKTFGKVGDRVIKANKKTDCPDSFWAITPEGGSSNDCFFVAKNRKRLLQNPRPFVHGGLTPEEVLIPFIRIVSKDESSEDMDLQLILGSHLTLTSTGWLIDLVLKVGKNDLKIVMVEAQKPFKSSKLKFPHLTSNSTHNFQISVSSEINQSGHTNLAFVASFHSDGETELDQSIFEFDLVLPEHNIIFDQGSQDFDDMFN